MKEQYLQYNQALSSIQTPCLFLDINAFEQNLNWALANAHNKKIRLATKSIRSKEILKKILSFSPVFQGLMCFDLREALWLRDEGFKDILVAYPTSDADSLKKLIENPSEITLMIDHLEQVQFIEKLSPKNKIQICLDVDLSMDLFFLKFGVYRSQLNTKEKFQKIIFEIKKLPFLMVTGIMGYEAQIAGLGDKNSFLIRFLKKISIKKLREKRKYFVQICKDENLILNIINGGGTGSFSSTPYEDIVTEITLGSGVFAPTLFDHYKDFTLSPALFFALPVTRRPEKNIMTCLGGGYIGSGSISSAKAPTPYLPEGLSLLPHEGAGEVQTPLKIPNNLDIQFHDKIIFRPAKAGEICERYMKIHLVRKNKIEGSLPTYRGEGQCFF